MEDNQKMPPKAVKPTTPELAKNTPSEETNTGKSEAKRLADMAGTGGSMFEGDKLTLEQVEGKEMVVTDFRVQKSTFKDGNYVTLQVTLDGKQYVINTEAKVPVKAFEAISKVDLPAPVKFVKCISKATGKPYWNIV